MMQHLSSILLLLNAATALRMNDVKQQRPYAVAHWSDLGDASFFGLFAMRSQMKRFNSIAKHVAIIDNTGGAKSEEYAQICQEVGIQPIMADGSFLQGALHDCVEPCWKQTFNKLLIFNQSNAGFEKMAMIDTDVFAVDNFDELFTHKPIGMAKWGDGTHNSGVLLVEPQKELFDKMAETLSELTSLETPLRGGPKEPHYGDQAFLRQFLQLGRSPSHKLNDIPAAFNARSASIDEILAEQNQKVHLIHFTVQKPYRDAPGGVKGSSTIGKHMCDFTAAAAATLMEHPILRSSKLYGHRFQSWETLVGQPQFVSWAHQNCLQFSKSSSRGFKQTLKVALNDAHAAFTAALNHP